MTRGALATSESGWAGALVPPRTARGASRTVVAIESGSPVLRSVCGRVITLRTDRWFGATPPEEEGVLDRALPPVLDIGCGPGRHTLALVRRGVPAMGIDSEPVAGRIAIDRGAPILVRSVFGRLPGAGAWGSALLLDGNVGIGGDPTTLLRRTRELLRPGGRALLEVEAPGASTHALLVRVERGQRSSGWFPWAEVGADRVPELADLAGFELAELWSDRGRWFARLDAR